MKKECEYDIKITVIFFHGSSNNSVGFYWSVNNFVLLLCTQYAIKKMIAHEYLITFFIFLMKCLHCFIIFISVFSFNHIQNIEKLS
jgi:hypothetical protein